MRASVVSCASRLWQASLYLTVVPAANPAQRGEAMSWTRIESHRNTGPPAEELDGEIHRQAARGAPWSGVTELVWHQRPDAGPQQGWGHIFLQGPRNLSPGPCPGGTEQAGTGEEVRRAHVYGGRVGRGLSALGCTLVPLRPVPGATSSGSKEPPWNGPSLRHLLVRGAMVGSLPGGLPPSGIRSPLLPRGR